jgi:hypothetical protein
MSPSPPSAAEPRKVPPRVVRVAGERLVFSVLSHSEPGVRYRVDLEADYFRGVCNCRWFECHVHPMRRANPGFSHECKHIQEALLAFARQVLREIRKEWIQKNGSSQADIGPA